MDATHLHSVEVVKGNFLVEAWGDIAAGAVMHLPGCPQNGRKAQKPTVIETKQHPYAHEEEVEGIVQYYDTVTCIHLTFDPKCETKRFYAVLNISGVTTSNGEEQTFEFDGSNFPK